MSFRRVETRIEILGEALTRGPDGPFNRLMDDRMQIPTEGPFYHGTNAILRPGEVITPQQSAYRDYSYPSSNPTTWGEPRPGTNYSFATRNIEVARNYSNWKDRHNDGYVYEVEPIKLDLEHDPEDFRSVHPNHPTKPDPFIWSGEWKYTGPSETFRSPTGWQVVRLVETVPGNPDYAS